MSNLRKACVAAQISGVHDHLVGQGISVPYCKLSLSVPNADVDKGMAIYWRHGVHREIVMCRLSWDIPFIKLVSMYVVL